MPAATARAVDACRDASARLLATLDGLDDATARGPSRLPSWTVGHVVTHLARNADSQVRMFEGAMAGNVADQYEGGLDGRAAQIAAGAERPAAELVSDLNRAIDDLDATWGRAPVDVWATGHGRMGNGEVCPCAEMPARRWREVEIHRVDLGLGAEPADWPDAYVELELPKALAQLPDRLSPPDRATLLAWLVGRVEGPPVLPPW
ncbi:MAG TPA: maleylpyruvate isomerase N-terminal domain-containing protein [Acidimicrobiales bacterium]